MLLNVKFSLSQCCKRTGGPGPAYVAHLVPAPVPTPVPAPVPAPVPDPVQPMEDVEEDPEMVYYFVDDEDGNVVAVDSPVPPLAAPVLEAPAPAAAGGDDPDDSGDGSDGDDSDEEEDNDGQDDNDNNEVNGTTAKRELCYARI